jgi:plastocyanin
MNTAHYAAISAPQAHAAPLSALNRLTAATLVGSAASLAYVQVMIDHAFKPDLTAIALIELGAAALIALPRVGRRRWAPLLGSLFGALTLVGNQGPILHSLGHPEALHLFAFMSVAVSIAFVMIVAGLAATAQNYRRPAGERPSPRGLATVLVAVVALVAGALSVAAIPREAGAGVSEEVLAGLPALDSPGFTFDQTELRVRVGELTAMRLDNSHAIPHSFDVDELNVHVAMPPGKSALALFRPTEPGTYTFYCNLPGHREAGMVGTLIVEP